VPPRSDHHDEALRVLCGARTRLPSGFCLGAHGQSALVKSPRLARSAQSAKLAIPPFWGAGYEAGDGIAVDRSGMTYVTQSASSADFPTTPSAFDTTFNGGEPDAFVTKVRTG
jgi:hypothetical protein